MFWYIQNTHNTNKAYLSDLIAATGLVFLLKIVNYQLFSLCDLEIWWITSKNNKTPFLYYFKFFVSFQSHRWILTGITAPKCSIWVNIGDFLSRLTLNLKDDLKQIRRFLKPCDLEIWRMTLENNRAPFLSYFKLCVSFRTHWWIQIGVTVRKHPIWVKFDDF